MGQRRQVLARSEDHTSIPFARARSATPARGLATARPRIDQYGRSGGSAGRQP